MKAPWRKRGSEEPAPAPGRLPPLDIEAAETPYGALLAITGELDLATVPRVRAATAEAPVAGAGTVVVDLTGVTFMDSTGIAVLIALEHELTERAGRMAIACPEGPARLLLDVTGLTEQLAVHPTREAAEAAVAER
jgi:anti-sigma B factor antagonist